MQGADQLVAAARDEVRRRLAEAGAAVALDGVGLADFVAGGKLLRSSLVIHAAQLGDTLLPLRMVRYATALELIHAGALCHDDVVDACRMRRGKPSVAAAVGPRAAVLAGLHLLARGAEMIAAEPVVVRRFVARAVRDAARGQVEELHDAFDEHVPPRACLDRARAKTGALYGLAARLGAWIGGLSLRATSAVAAYGEHFGMAFQLADDIRDLIGGPTLGREAGTDVRRGVYTLPILWTLQGPPAERDLLLQWIGQPGTEAATAEIRALLLANGSIARTARLAARYVDRACAALRPLPRSDAREQLVAAARALLDGVGEMAQIRQATAQVVPCAVSDGMPVGQAATASPIRPVAAAEALVERFLCRAGARSCPEANWLQVMASALAVAATALLRVESVSSAPWREDAPVPIADASAVAAVDLLVADFFTLLCVMPGRAGSALARLLGNAAARSARRTVRPTGQPGTLESDLVALAEEAGRVAAEVRAAQVYPRSPAHA